MNEIERYAITTLHEGAEGVAEDDLNECEAIDDRDHPAAVKLSIAMAHAVRDNAESFLAWFRSVQK